MLIERRRKRSNFYGLSLHYWLAAVAHQTRLSALILADSSGMLLAGSSRGPDAEEMAAVAPLMGQNSFKQHMTVGEHHRPMKIQRFCVDEASLYLCAVGESVACDASLKTASGGVERILRAASS